MDYSLRIAIAVAVAMISCLNPYSNGLLSEKYDNFNLRYTRVLILILMDYSLSFNKRGKKIPSKCLNPYSNGLLSENP